MAAILATTAVSRRVDVDQTLCHKNLSGTPYSTTPLCGILTGKITCYIILYSHTNAIFLYITVQNRRDSEKLNDQNKEVKFSESL